MQISEIFYSLQGESRAAGRLCGFVRLAGCNLNCRYCDTGYARDSGQSMTVDEVVAAVAKLKCRLVEVTGGEPLLQPAAVELLDRLADNDYEVLLESNGSILLPTVRRYRVILDMKCPGSGAGDSFEPENLQRLQDGDEIKFVIADHRDFVWAVEKIATLNLAVGGREIIMSPVFDQCPPADLASWILAEKPPVRLQLQLHRLIWPEGEPK